MIRNSLYNQIKHICVVLLCSTLTNCEGSAPKQTDLNANSPLHISDPLQEVHIITEAEVTEAKVTRGEMVKTLTYNCMNGKSQSIQIDTATITVKKLYETIRVKENLKSISLIYKHTLLSESDDRPLREVLDLKALDAFTLVINNNISSAIELLDTKDLSHNYLGEEIWAQLETKEAINVPLLEDTMLQKLELLIQEGHLPILALDPGYSIEKMYHLKMSILKSESTLDDFRKESYYKASNSTQPRWILLPGSDAGVLTGSRNQNYAQQLDYMKANYPDFRVGTVRELVTVAMLKIVQDNTVLFPKHPLTFGRCEEKYQQSDWQGYGIRVGGNNGVEGGLIFSHFSEHDSKACEGLFCCFSA